MPLFFVGHANDSRLDRNGSVANTPASANSNERPIEARKFAEYRSPEFVSPFANPAVTADQCLAAVRHANGSLQSDRRERPISKAGAIYGVGPVDIDEGLR